MSCGSKVLMEDDEDISLELVQTQQCCTGDTKKDPQEIRTKGLSTEKTLGAMRITKRLPHSTSCS